MKDESNNLKPPSRWKPLSEIEARQRNTVWPDTLKNGALVDAFLWKGSPDATHTQRIGIAFFGLLFLSPAVLLVRFGCFEPGPALLKTLMFLLALPWLVIGGKLLRNALRH